MSAADSILAPEPSAVAENGAAVGAVPPRRRLFRKYALLLIALVGATLVVTSGFEFWFSYQENKATLVRIQQEKAAAAAARIHDFVEDIQRQIGWTTHAQWAAGPLDQRRQDYFRLLRQVPPITELTQLDGTGREQLKVSRLAMDAIGSEADFSQSPAFTQAKAQRVWFSPVYFRKQSEPYLTLAIANDGRNAGVTVAEINLKLIQDVIAALKIGQGGYAYVVDGRGRLIAHPDISLVLRDTDLSHLPQVAAALPHAASSASAAGGAGPGPAQDPVSAASAGVSVAKSLAGRSVLTAHTAIAPLGWLVFVEVPLREAFAPLYGAALRTGVLLLLGLGAAALVALLLARRMTGPIRAIAQGAERLGRGELDRRLDIRTGDELEGLAQQFNRMAGDLQQSYAELEQRVRDRTVELSEALEQQTATAEVLGVINSSPGDLAPVFDAILEKAHSLCGVTHGALESWDGARLRGLAIRGLPEPFAGLILAGREPGPNDPHWSLVGGQRFVHIPDMAAVDNPAERAAVKLAGLRTFLAVALRKDNVLLGRIVAARREVRPFTEKEIALLESFAAQAVIAMENARLITETREALEQQTATAEVLGVINSSPGDLAPVFDAMLEKAMRLCEAVSGHVFAFEGDNARIMALRGLAEFADIAKQWPAFPPPPNTALARVANGADLVHIPDVREVAGYGPDGSEPARNLLEVGNCRTLLTAALRKDGKALGAISVYRQEVRPFSEKQIALLQNFAAQAVIAMENARLITETREALEQQTATAEVLGVINSSPGDLAPVFDAMLEKAMHLCGAAFGALTSYDGERITTRATRGFSPELAEVYRQPSVPSPGSNHWRLLNGDKLVQHVDLSAPDVQRSASAQTRALVEIGGARSGLMLPLRKDGTFLGSMWFYRQEVRPFTDKQIALLQNFAAQAVIAMENARLITETREALEQQTATAEVLGVINSSPGDLAPVFDAMLERAMRLCEATFGELRTYQNGEFQLAAIRGVPAAYAEFMAQRVPTYGPGTGPARILEGERIVHIADLTETDAYRNDERNRRALVDLGGARTLVLVPLFKDATVLGFIMFYRQEVRPFSDKQIALLQNFAAQAVIAMENARLITETREALEQQTATAEVLGVINSSPGDLAPVFGAMVEKAIRLCEGACGHLLVYDGQHVTPAAVRGGPEYTEYMRSVGLVSPGIDTPVGRALRGEAVVHIVDAREEEIYRTNEGFREQADRGRFRSMLVVGLRREDTFLGTLTVFRQEVRPFTDKHIALLQNFAAQAVIAMENARLITETREALEQQTATAEVLGVINASPGDLAPVFDAILEKAHALCGAEYGSLQIAEGEAYRAVATRGLPEAFAETLRQPFKLGPNHPVRRLLAGTPVVTVDLAEGDDLILQNAARLAGMRTGLFVPLPKDDGLLGYIVAGRKEVRPFTDKQIALLQNFAAQAVIAMENARLLNETRERTRELQESLEYQTATSDVLKVISQSTFDLQPVLETVAETAARLCDSEIVTILRRQGEVYRVAAAQGWSPEYKAFLENHSFTADRGTLTGRVVLDRRAVQVADVSADPEYALTEAATLGKARTQLGVPLLREGSPIGVIIVSRQRVQPFTQKQIELVTTFADQAVIAIENARLLNELRERTQELARSVEELKTLGEVGQAVSSTLDLNAVLSTILSRSVGLTGSDAGAIFRYRRAARSFRLFDAVGWDEALVSEVQKLDIAEGVTAIGEATARRVPVQIADLQSRASNPLRDINLAAGYRAALIVPLVGADRAFGAIVLQRRTAGEFPEATVRLMQTLASQSVLAIQNARLFNEIAEKSEQLAEASRHKSQFLANMSHELRTPLNAILGYTELMVDGIYGELPPRAAGVLERVQNNGKHLLALINDVLDLSKIEAGQLVLTLEDYALPDVVQSVVSAAEGLANTKGLKFTAEIAPSLPTGHGDARRLSQVLLNLVGNAVKFTDAGEVAIRAGAENGHFVLTVRDTGPGIAPEDHGKIFEEFQQVDSSNTRKKGGTGLGLAISKRMVEMQGGSITVDSELGKGATFRVSLPVRVESVDELAGEMPGEMMGAA